ncbi:protein tyrosine phosphatase family protein [Shewanella marinintestina]|uniref:protein tyrosine phosphatase family protein n=1 Tax=Shewanella marinintestina TaxID=190305 RepID=UPI00200E55F5|nr:protein tyrosine phosphatase family protein [Shewanella marinintestina]MCL1145471.1 protein tyrosine phosphatase family protein [Shewanella marinintestina]
MRFILLLTSLLSPLAFAAITPDALQQVKDVQFNSDRVITAGLPTQSQFKALQESGVELVINLIPKDNQMGYANEAELVKQAGMDYAQIDVDWKQPTVANVQQFFAIMDANQDKQILVHCAANYRASAFYYLYQLTRGQSDSKAYQQQVMAPWGELSTSLQEYPQWQVLIEQVKSDIAQ